MGKNETQISGFAVMKKAPSPLKKILPAYLCRYDLQNCVRKSFLNKWVFRYLSFGDFNVLKNCSSQ